MTAADTLDPVAQRAIDWLVLLRSGSASAEDHIGFDFWRLAHPQHDAACCRLERALGRVRGFGGDAAARQALLATDVPPQALLGPTPQRNMPA